MVDRFGMLAGVAGAGQVSRNAPACAPGLPVHNLRYHIPNLLASQAEKNTLLGLLRLSMNGLRGIL